MKRLLLFCTVASMYGVVLGPSRGVASNDARVDPLTPKARSVEQAIGSARFADALALALEINRAFPKDPLPDVWLAKIFKGLDRPQDEIDAWERYLSRSSAPEMACPAIAEAYGRLGRRDRIVAAYKRCTDIDPRDPQRFLDLAAAYTASGDTGPALEAYRQAQRLDPQDPSIPRRIRALEEVRP